MNLRNLRIPLKFVAAAVGVVVLLAVLGVAGASAKVKSAVGNITSYRAPTTTKGGQVTIGKVVYRLKAKSKVPSWVRAGAKAKVFYTGKGKARDIVNAGKKKDAPRIRDLASNNPGQGNDSGDCPNCGSSGGGGGGGT